MWESLVELVRAAIVTVAHACGGSLGAAVLVVSFGLRIALLPLTLRIARQARQRQALLAELKPRLERLRARHANDPAALLRETQALYRANGLRLFSADGIAALAIQAPLFAALFGATRRGLGAKVRFLWVAELARPDALLAWGVSVLTAIVMANAMSASGSSTLPANAVAVLALVVGAGTLVFLWSASSAVALSMGAGSLATLVQSWVLAREWQFTPESPSPKRPA